MVDIYDEPGKDVFSIVVGSSERRGELPETLSRASILGFSPDLLDTTLYETDRRTHSSFAVGIQRFQR